GDGADAANISHASSPPRPQNATVSGTSGRRASCRWLTFTLFPPVVCDTCALIPPAGTAGGCLSGAQAVPSGTCTGLPVTSGRGVKALALPHGPGAWFGPVTGVGQAPAA